MRARPPHVYAYELPARTILHPFFSIACPAPLTPTATQKGLGGCVWRASSSLFPLFTCSSLCHFSNRFDSRKVALFWLIANCCRTENAMKWIGVYIGISCFHFRSKRMDNGNFLPRTYITTRVRFWINYFKVKSILSFFSRVKNLHFPNIIGLCDDLSNFQIPLLSIKLNPTEYSIESINQSRKLSKISQDFSKYGRLTTLEWRDLERWSDFRNTWLGRGRNHDTGPCQSRMNDKFGRVQGEEKNQKSRCAGVHGLKGIYTDGRYLSARLPSLYSRLTKCLCTRTDPEWIELRSTRLRLWGASPPPYLPQTSTVSALLNIKRNGTTVPTEISLATTDSVFSHVFSRKVYVSRGSVSMKSTSRSILLSRIYSYAWIFISFSSQSFIWIHDRVNFHSMSSYVECFYYNRFWISTLNPIDN